MAKAITKEEAIDTIIQDVHQWDTENVIEFAKQLWAKELGRLSNKALESEYNSSIGSYDKDDDNEGYVKILKPTKATKVLYGKNK